mgnify:CR=1 FL=1|jgi:alpha-L-fucosidase
MFLARCDCEFTLVKTQVRVDRRFGRAGTHAATESWMVRVEVTSVHDFRTTRTRRSGVLAYGCEVRVFMTLVTLLLNVAGAASTPPYTPDWDSLMTRPLPGWFDKAKIGIFLHWGVFSVSSIKPEAWYWWSLDGAKDPSTVAFHNRTYGPDFKYAEFMPMFKAELWDPMQWAQLFKAAGAKYVVLTSKHHEGFTNWCSKNSFNWNSCDGGPRRDIVGELTDAVRAEGLHMGLYHSIFEWFHPLYLQDKANNFTTRRFVDEVYYPEAIEINTKYQPDLIWSDGDWEANSSYWRSPELLAWLYNEAPNRDKVIVNDRWGNDNPPIASGKHFGGYFSGGDRQQATPELLAHKWENAFTIDSNSWGYNRWSNLADYLNITTILYEVVSAVAYGGNALINVGPTADGRIATIFQERLAQLGAWLGTNGEAVYDTTKWREQNDTATHGIEQGVYYTASKTSASTVYAFMMGWPDAGNVLTLHVPKTSSGTTVRMIGCAVPMQWTPLAGGAGLSVSIPPLSPKQLPSLEGPWVFELQGVW